MNEPEENLGLNLEKVVATLSQHHEEWKWLIRYFEEEKNKNQSDLKFSIDPYEVMNRAGRISTIQEIIDDFTPKSK